MKVIADTLGVARSNLIEQSGTPRSEKGRRSRRGDEGPLALIKLVIDARPSYGYRRVTALVNRTLLQAGQPRINGKRVLRIMQMNNLTLERHTACRPGRTHEGVVIALKSNIRWCSDHFEVHCRDGAIVRVLFAIDACEREINKL